MAQMVIVLTIASWEQIALSRLYKGPAQIVGYVRTLFDNCWSRYLGYTRQLAPLPVVRLYCMSVGHFLVLEGGEVMTLMVLPIFPTPGQAAADTILHSSVAVTRNPVGWSQPPSRSNRTVVPVLNAIGSAMLEFLQASRIHEYY